MRADKVTQLLNAAVTLTGAYQYFAFDISDLGSFGIGGKNQVMFHFVRASGSTITCAPQELPSYASAGTELIDYQPQMKDDGSGTLTPIEFTSTEASFGFSCSTICDNMRVGVKGTGVYAVYATVAVVS